ncbi:MAG TPA: EAL domain-containing protein, partial [Rhodocyclaceae bacterium]|nr:EAL domain-containing protein [Rhodocyclaceae bacterium]
GTGVVDLRIYNRLGMTVFATDVAQVGQSIGENASFRVALGGRDSTALMAGEPDHGASPRQDVLTTFVPFVNEAGELDAVVEIRQDVSPFTSELGRNLWWVTAGVVAVFSVLYLLQFLVVRRAHQILRIQDAKLETARATLEIQVEQRTAELKRANRLLEGEVAERRQAESKLNYLAYHDPLTGLPNRRRFVERLGESAADAAPRSQRLAVLFIDLDQFKQVNDSLGHTIGDELLVAVATRLSEHVRLIDMLARLGGDEFICLMEAVKRREEAATLAGEIIAAFERPFTIAGHELYLSASVGISLFPDDGEDVGALMRNADSAMYRAKHAGRGHYHFYTADITERIRERVRLENLLRRARENGELEVFLQQQVDADTGRLTGAEALVRWHSPELGEVPPARFIEVAEETGLIVGLGSWVLRETCRQVVAWQAEGFDLPQVSVNLSVKQLERPEFIAMLTAILEETGLEPHRLKLEITESVVMQVDNAIVLLDRLRSLGICLAIDDFGTGYSSLSYLKLMPIQQLKIDRSFVAGIGKSRGDEAIITTVMALARSLSLEVVAEGVETSEQAAFLRNLGCRQLQGFLHGQPVDAREFEIRWSGS